MAISIIGKNLMLDRLASVAVKVRLYDSTGAEILSHTSASQDKIITWGTASASSVAMTGSVDFQVLGGKTVATISIRNLDGTTEYARDEIPVGSRESFTNDGIFTLSGATMSLT